MSKSPQFKQAILHNLERLNMLTLSIERGATLYTVYPQDYSKHSYLRNQKSPSVFASFFLQKVF